jgi:hypothetical protein
MKLGRLAGKLEKEKVNQIDLVIGNCDGSCGRRKKRQGVNPALNLDCFIKNW